MPQNEGVLDRDLRLGAGLLMFLFGFFGTTGILQIVLSVIGLILLATSAMGFCPLYAIFRINTAAKESKQ